MKILLINKFYYLRGGAEKYFLEQEKELKARGHEVAVFSMHHPKNLTNPYEKYWLSRLSFNEGFWKEKLRAPGRILYSFQARRKLKALLKVFKPEIVHLHNIYHQISPSILPLFKKRGIPVVMHLHDYKLVCPNYQLLNHGQICYRCRGGNYFQACRTKCFKDSWVMSFLVSLEMFLHHRLLKIYKKNISLFISPSKFMKETCVTFGWPEDKIKVLLNFSQKIEASHQVGNYYLYFGRLSPEKGIEVALQSGLKIKVVGTGPQRDYLKRKYPQAEFLGFKSGAELESLIKNCRAVLMPSVWLENMPFSIIEALSYGKAVIASDLGGLPELLKTGAGFLFRAGDYRSLGMIAEKLTDQDLEKAGQKALEMAKKLNSQDHFLELEKIYKDLVNNDKNG